MRVGHNNNQMICTPELWSFNPSLLKEALQAGDDFLYRCFLKFGQPKGLADGAATSLGLVIGLSALGAALLSLAAVALLVVRHHSTCEHQDCPHRHPGWLHSTAASLGIHAFSRGCKRCAWDGEEPDMAVSFDEIEGCLTARSFVAQGAYGAVYRATWRGRGELAVW
mmetsp:Transcript_37919/g.107144  ORF Transcript_37919/g.107144 Transcript_37919/m.107144 type:complete len:167 (+) Transcript_37919:615-1115(+)